MPKCYIFDIDGTLANGDHRLHHIKQEPKNWDAYFMACDADEPHLHITGMARHLFRAGMHIVCVSGRSDICRDATEKWLKDNMVPCSALYMRRQGDHKNDDVLKIELLEQLKADGYEPIMAFDDRNRVVEAWRAAGIPCAQVASGDF